MRSESWKGIELRWHGEIFKAHRVTYRRRGRLVRARIGKRGTRGIAGLLIMLIRQDEIRFRGAR